jgi:hypothetical protein
MRRRFIVFLPLKTQKEPPAATKRLHRWWNLYGDEDRKSWSLKCALADGTNAAVEKYRALRHSLVAALEENYPYRSTPGKGLEATVAAGEYLAHASALIAVRPP